METIVSTKNIFINSSSNVQGNGTRFNVRAHDMLTLPKNADFYRIILNEFSMRRNFYKVNSTNNAFQVHVINITTTIFFNVYVPVGDYSTRTALGEAIVLALKNALQDNGLSTVFTNLKLDTSTIEYDKKFKMTLDKATSSQLNIYFKKDPSITDGSTPYSNFYQLIGGRVNVNDPIEPWYGYLNVTAGATSTQVIYSGFYQMQTETESHLYLRTNLVNDSLSNHHNLNNLTDNCLIGSNVLAKIVCTEEWITYDSSDLAGGSWFLDLGYRNLTELNFYLTDGDGRDLPLIDSQQNINGNMFCKMSLIIQAIKVQY